MFSNALMQFMYGTKSQKESKSDKEVPKKDDYTTKPITYLILKCSVSR